jgi:hypothetical protein
VLARFTELEDERTAINAQLTDLATTDPGPGDPALLDALPLLGDLLPNAPARLQQQLYDAFDLQALYKKNMHQVTIHVTITDSTPRAVAAIINDASDHPGATAPDPGEQAPFSDLPQAPMSGSATTIMENRAGAAWVGGSRRCWRSALLAGGVAGGQAAGSPATAAATFGYTATAPANSEPKSAGTISTSRPGIGAWSIFPPPR